MTDNHFVDKSDKSVYATREEALEAPGAVYNHYKGGVYRAVGKVKYQAGLFIPQDGDELQIYEHIFPHEHGLYARHPKDFNQDIVNKEYAFKGKRFDPVPGPRTWEPDPSLVLECDCTSWGHHLKFNCSAPEDLNHPEVWVESFLQCEAGFFNRVWESLQYIFGQRKWLGNFSTTLLSERQLLQLKDFVDSTVDRITVRR